MFVYTNNLVKVVAPPLIPLRNKKNSFVFLQNYSLKKQAYRFRSSKILRLSSSN